MAVANITASPPLCLGEGIEEPIVTTLDVAIEARTRPVLIYTGR